MRISEGAQASTRATSGTLVEKLQLKAYDAYLTRSMAITPSKTDFVQFEMAVAAVRDLSDRVRRITFSADGFRTFHLTGPDEYFALLMPRDGKLRLPQERLNVRAAIAKLPEADQPEIRWYTIRAHRPDAGEIDVDIVLHGDAGPGSAWACRAEEGQVVGFRSGAAPYDPSRFASPRLFVADETAVPALAAILEREAGAIVFVEVPDESCLASLGREADVRVVLRGDAAPGEAVVAALRETDLSGIAYAWACGESGLATGVRRYLIGEVGLDKRAVFFSGYWKVGEARG